MMHPPAQSPAAVGLQLWRISEDGELVADNLNGDLVKLKDARYAMNAMQSVIASTEVAGLHQSHELVKFHKERGDMLRVWSIIGDPNTQGQRQDVFERVQKIVDLNQQQAEEIKRLKAKLAQVEVMSVTTEEDVEMATLLERTPRLGWTIPEADNDALCDQVLGRIMDCNSPTQISVTRKEWLACVRALTDKCGKVTRSPRNYVIFHSVELVPQ
jgi:hypothetical protein